MQGKTPHPATRHFAPILILLLAVLLAAACGGKRSGNGGGAATPDSTGADSLVSADSTALADSAAGKKPGGFFARFRKNNDKEEEKDESVPVELSRVDLRDVPSYLSATASLEPEKQVEILAKAAGQIVELRVEEGDFVSAGQVLALLDGETQKIALEEARLKARSLELEFERSQALHAEQGISERELQDVRFRYEEAEAQRQAAEINLEHTRILAPFAGYVAERFVDRGQHLAVGSRLCNLVDADPLLARIYLPEKEAVNIHPGQELVITPDSRPDLDLPGEVLRLAPIVDTRTGTVKVTCQVSGAAGELRPGSFVRVKIQTDLHANVTVIPKRALVPEGGENYVYKVLADSVIKVGVETGYSNGHYVEITDGLELGDQVVEVGTGSLKTGSKIREIGVEPAPALADSLADVAAERS